MGLGRTLALTAIVVTGCVSSSASTCADGSSCRDGTVCIALGTPGDPHDICVTPDQVTACLDKPDGAPCTATAGSGTCFGKACVLAVCGDGLVDTTEVCDDANTLPGDGCSSDCKSTEVCGNGITDLITGEECDDGNLELSGDGCSVACNREYRLWRNVTPNGPPQRAGYGLATDLNHGVLMFGGGSYGASVPYDVDKAQFADTWRWDGFTWIDLRPVVSPPRRSHPALAYDRRRGRVVMFGGFNSNGMAMSDIWEWDGVSWRDRTPLVLGPHARSDAAFACTDTECVLFGGAKNGGTTYHVDTWTWDGTSWTQITSLASPTGRRNAQMVYDPIARRLVLFGGDAIVGTTDPQLFDTWTYEAGQWTQRISVGIPPHPSQTPTMAWDDVAQQIVLIAQGNTWTLDSGFAWTSLGLTPPANIDVPVLAWDEGNAQLLAVGQALVDPAMAMAKRFVGWSALSELGPASGAGTPAAYDAHRGLTIVLDPAVGTFEWNGVGFRRTTSQGPAKHEPQLAYHVGCGVTLSFGGKDGADIKSNETWRYGVDGTGSPAWTQIVSTPLPSPRIRDSMTYDSVRGVVLMFGGRAATAVTNELWQLTSPGCAPNGWAWTQLANGQTPAPSARAGAAMAFDEKRGVAVLFGGHDATLADLADTWEWDGTRWTERIAKMAPPVRSDHAMAYDPRRGRVIVFGGRGDSGQLDDAWEWDGAAGTWLKLSPAVLPAARSEHAFAMDVTGALIAVGGQTPGGPAPVLRLSSELSTAPREECIDATLNLDGDGLHGCADPDCWTRCAPTCPPGVSCAEGCGDGTCNRAIEDYVICPVDCPVL